MAHPNLTTDELDRLIKKNIRVDRATLRAMDGVTDLFSQVENDPQLIE